ncbi:MAG: threonine-phosphate decarboxylase CobD [Massilia sp.]
MLEHGGNLNDARARFGRDDWIDLSTGLNPHGYPAPVLPPDAWHRLPERNPLLLRAASEYYGTPQMLAVAGSQAVIQMLPRLRAPSRVVVAAPSYAEHAHHWAQHGHTLTQVPYADLDDALPQCDVMVVCNPNNPTGATLAPERLRDWAQQLSARGGWLIVDEAFCDMTPELSVARWSHHPGLIVLRSLGKFFGLAGARVGFVGAHRSLLDPLESALGPWPISGPAQAIAAAALMDTQWQHANFGSLAEAGTRLHNLLSRHGVHGAGTALFQWWPEPRAEQFWQHMAERGIWVRLFPQAARGIRLGLPPDADGWKRLDAALTQWNQEHQ